MPNVIEKELVEASLVVTKASFNKAEPDPNKKRRITMVNSDTAPDLYEESMSVELFSDFCRRIENNVPIPEEFKSAVCEDFWCGGMPYVSIAHYPAGRDGKNVPGMPESVYVDGKMLKSKAFLYDNELGRRLFDALCVDLEKRSKGESDISPVRVSIGFLDLEHEHIFEGKTITFTRTERGQVCPLCKDGNGSKIYKKGHLVHLAATRVPVNPRTEMSLEEKSMGEIITKKDDAASIVGEDLAGELETKSQADDVLVIRSEDLERRVSKVRSSFYEKFVPPSTPRSDPWLVSVMDDSVVVELEGKLYKAGYSVTEDKVSFEDKKKWEEVVPGFIPKSVVLWEKSETNAPSEMPFASCYDPNTDAFDQKCINASMEQFMASIRNDMNTVKSLVGEVEKSLKNYQASPVVEESMEPKKDDKEVKEEVKEDEKETKEEMKKSEVAPIDAAFEQLKSLLGSNPTAEQVQSAFNELGQEVEKSYVPPAPSATDIEAIVRSAVEAAIKPLAIELAQVKAQKSVPVTQSQEHPVSRALSLKPQELMQKSGAQAPARKYSQIETLARRSTGASVE